MSVIKYVPNILTVVRIVGVFVGSAFLFKNTAEDAVLAFVIYTVVAITDFFDGYIARKFDAISAFGKLMDPIADKVYILGLYFSFVLLSFISQWLIWPIALREIVVTIVRLQLVGKGIVVAAEKSGKVKTFMQNISLLVIFICFFVERYIQDAPMLLVVCMYALLVYVVFLTLSSGFDFFKNNWQEIRVLYRGRE